MPYFFFHSLVILKKKIPIINVLGMYCYHLLATLREIADLSLGVLGVRYILTMMDSDMILSFICWGLITSDNLPLRKKK